MRNIHIWRENIIFEVQQKEYDSETNIIQNIILNWMWTIRVMILLWNDDILIIILIFMKTGWEILLYEYDYSVQH